VVDVGRIMVESGKSPDHTAHDCHRVRIAPETAEKSSELLVHHRVVRDVVDKLFPLLGGRQLAVEQKISDLHEVALIRQFFDRVTAIEQNPLVAVYISDVGTTGGGRHKAGIVGEMPGLGIKLADIDNARAN